MPALAIWTPHEGLLSTVAPLGLAAAAGTALVVDLDPDGPRYPGGASLARLVADAPRRADLVPSRSGTAVLRNGGVAVADAQEVVEALIGGWPHLVLRVAAPEAAMGLAPLVPVRALLPGILAPRDEGQSVYQKTGFTTGPPGPGPLLPRLRPRLLGSLLNGAVEPRSRWVAAWRRVWGLPWR